MPVNRKATPSRIQTTARYREYLIFHQRRVKCQKDQRRVDVLSVRSKSLAGIFVRPSVTKKSKNHTKKSKTHTTAAARGAPRHDQRRGGWGLRRQGSMQGVCSVDEHQNSKTNLYTFVLHRARLKSIMHPWRPTW